MNTSKNNNNNNCDTLFVLLKIIKYLQNFNFFVSIAIA